MATTVISALLCTYAGDQSEHLERAVRSLVDQTRRPDEIVVVKDGPLPDELDRVLHSIERNTDIPFTWVQFNENRGRGAARRASVSAASGEYVVIQDADDIAVPDRIERSVAALEETGADLIGGFIAEFSSDPEDIESVRSVPCSPTEIRSTARVRSPINQTTVVARRSAILEAGNYRPFDVMEDYDLWVRMILHDKELQNIPTVFTRVRADEEMYRRRGGLRRARDELRIQFALQRYGFISIPRALVNTVSRVTVRLLPVSLRRRLIRTLERS